MGSYRVKVVAFSIAVGWCGIAQADDAAVQRYKDYLPEQILRMPESERKGTLPIMFIGAANLANAPGGKLIMQSHLNSLMYNGIADFDGAKKAFQKDLGERPTGKLTVWQIHSLGYRASRTRLTTVSFFPLEHGGTITGDYASVKGTLKIIDERIAYPINHVAVECFRAQGYCKYIQVVLNIPDENSWSQTYSISTISDEIYKITRWEKNQIDAVPNENNGCRTNQLSFNFETKEFFEIARNNTSGDCEMALGITFPRLDKPRLSEIVDGEEIVNMEFKRLNEEAYGYYASDFRARVDVLNAASDKSDRPKP